MHKRSGSAKSTATASTASLQSQSQSQSAAAATAAAAPSSSSAARQRPLQQQASTSESTSGVSTSNSSNSDTSNACNMSSVGQARQTGAGPRRGDGGKTRASGPGANGSGGGTSASLVEAHSGSDKSNGDNYFSVNAMNSLKEAFKFFDIDQDGRITSGELQKVLKFLGTKVTEHEVKLMIADVDSDGNGTVEFNEFIKMMTKYYRKNAEEHSEDADMWEAFKAFDHNGDNFIDFAEIKKTMHFLGEEVSDEDVRSMIQEADVDNDGRINFEEFKKMMAVMQQRGQ